MDDENISQYERVKYENTAAYRRLTNNTFSYFNNDTNIFSYLMSKQHCTVKALAIQQQDILILDTINSV